MGVAIVLVDGTERIEIQRGTPEWEASCEWARFHGLDPNRIPEGSEIIRDEVGRRILFKEFVFDDNDELVTNGLDVLTRRCVEQGEAPPLPFPTVT